MTKIICLLKKEVQEIINVHNQHLRLIGCNYPEELIRAADYSFIDRKAVCSDFRAKDHWAKDVPGSYNRCEN